MCVYLLVVYEYILCGIYSHTNKDSGSHTKIDDIIQRNEDGDVVSERESKRDWVRAQNKNAENKRVGKEPCWCSCSGEKKVEDQFIYSKYLPVFNRIRFGFTNFTSIEGFLISRMCNDILSHLFFHLTSRHCRSGFQANRPFFVVQSSRKWNKARHRKQYTLPLRLRRRFQFQFERKHKLVTKAPPPPPPPFRIVLETNPFVVAILPYFSSYYCVYVYVKFRPTVYIHRHHTRAHIHIMRTSNHWRIDRSKNTTIQNKHKIWCIPSVRCTTQPVVDFVESMESFLERQKKRMFAGDRSINEAS